MQASHVSRDLRDKFDRIMRDANEQYALAGRAPSLVLCLAHALDSAKYYAQAWAVADCAAMLTTREYGAWTHRRSHAFSCGKEVEKRINTLVDAIRRSPAGVAS